VHFYYIMPVSLPWTRRSQIKTESNQNGSPTSLEPAL